MGLLFALLALGGLYYFYSGSSYSDSEGQKLDPTLDKKFATVLTALANDKVAFKTFSHVNGGGTDAQEKERWDNAVAKVRAAWADKSPHDLAVAGIEIRLLGDAAVKFENEDPKPADQPAIAETVRMTVEASNMIKARVQELTGQGENFDLAFKEIDADKGASGTSVADLSPEAMVMVSAIDKAKLSPLVFIKKKDVASAGDSLLRYEGDFVDQYGSTVGTGKVVSVRDIAVVGDMYMGTELTANLGIGEVESYTLSKPLSPSAYFGSGTNVYVYVPEA